MSNAALLMSQNQEDLTSENKTIQAFSKYLKVNRVCPTNKAIGQGCWKKDTPIYKYDGTKVYSSIDAFGGAAACMNIVNGSVFCVDFGGTLAVLYYDVNGVKKPNTIGKDIFFALISINTYMIRPARGVNQGWGAADGTFKQLTSGDGTCGSDPMGYACSADKLLK